MQTIPGFQDFGNGCFYVLRLSGVQSCAFGRWEHCHWERLPNPIPIPLKIREMGAIKNGLKIVGMGKHLGKSPDAKVQMFLCEWRGFLGKLWEEPLFSLFRARDI